MHIRPPSQHDQKYRLSHVSSLINAYYASTPADGIAYDVCVYFVLGHP